MAEKILNLDKVNIKIQKQIESFCIKLLENSVTWIDSIILYGSATGSDFIEAHSNVNLLIIVKEFSINNFKPLLSVFEKYFQKGFVSPLIFTSQEIKESTDVFPIEFFDIKENHILLWGQDLIKDIDIKFDNLRLQCEFELKGKIIKLRQMYLNIGRDKKSVKNVLESSLSSFIPIFKNILRLKKKTLPENKEDIIKMIGKELNIDIEIILTILYDKKGKTRIADDDIIPSIEKFLLTLTKIASVVDKL
ncbi:hypothetical protein HZA55_00720 [Candidatus Poribacteria bacterium]|nr:hypothetical protein [Candidatus Poribacteria bacterium]